jgi:two-component system sensor histidine kinase VicK
LTNIFYKRLPAVSKQKFQSLYLLQNLHLVKISSFIIFCLNLFTKIVSLFFESELALFNHFEEHRLVNFMQLLVLPVFYFLSRLMIKDYPKKTKVRETQIRIFIIFFGTYLIVSGMLISFIALHNPHNTLTFYMVALVITSIVLVLEIQETLLLILITEIVFSILLKAYGVDTVDFVYNQLANVALLAGFYFISRYNYVYKAKNFVQLMQIEQINTELQKAGTFKNEVLGMVAHDLRNPLAAIESIASLMQMEELDNETEENLGMIKASCVKAREIVNELLEAARDESDAELVTTIVNINNLLECLVNEWENQNISNEIVFISDVKDAHCQINTEKFHRVLDNMIGNAVKFSNDTDKIEVRLNADEQEVCIEVKDFGVGIPAELLPHIFDRFSKSSRDGLRGEKSTGLGLNIAQRIVEKHMGRVDVESVENQGSVFRICLPRVDASFIDLNFN